MQLVDIQKFFERLPKVVLYCTAANLLQLIERMDEQASALQGPAHTEYQKSRQAALTRCLDTLGGHQFPEKKRVINELLGDGLEAAPVLACRFHTAIEAGLSSLAIETLKKPNFDPNYLLDDQSPLMIAAAHGQAKVVNVLLAHPATKIDLANSRRQTALNFAKDRFCTRAIEQRMTALSNPFLIQIDELLKEAEKDYNFMVKRFGTPRPGQPYYSPDRLASTPEATRLAMLRQVHGALHDSDSGDYLRVLEEQVFLISKTSYYSADDAAWAIDYCLQNVPGFLGYEKPEEVQTMEMHPSVMQASRKSITAPA